MEVYWLEQNVSSVAAGDAWLSETERVRLAQLRIPKRLSDWRLGRWTVKCALSSYWGLARDFQHLAELELRPMPSGAPMVFFRGSPVRLALSLSHSGDRGLCAIGPEAVAIGCDLEIIEERNPAFMADFFTEDEQNLAAETPFVYRDRLVTLLWSAKESALKALGCGLRADTRSVNAVPDSFPEGTSAKWNPLSVACGGGKTFRGWWSKSGSLVRTLVAEPAPRRIIALRPPGIHLAA